jgi:hypothetical protein
VFALTVTVLTSGYFIQPIIESFLFSSGLEAVITVSGNRSSAVLTGLMPSSVTAYVILAVDNSRTRWLKGCAAAALALTAFDFLVTLRGGIPFRSFFFCTICNFIGGPIGVVIVWIVYTWTRRFRRQESPHTLSVCEPGTASAACTSTNAGAPISVCEKADIPRDKSQC